ncbi:DDE-type integrase/transposase/recombinase [Glaciibacter superstes]|uniref:DDE-type integrase/transposase/recombinase n=1 Tax=Glaciibacter superstes TaxID=501023 RepID=UPI0003B4C7F9|nr:DDE-type integrase/transposase/recombinase [Glaciibacter superstes]
MTDVQHAAYETGRRIEDELIQTLREAGLSQNRVLAVIGLSKGSFHYRRKPRPRTVAPVPHAARPHPARLTGIEREQIAESLKKSVASVAETFYEDLDGGRYVASLSSYHRIARQESIPMNATGSRRRRTGSERDTPTPVLTARAPGEVACWDISFLPGPFRGEHYALYAVIDLFSRKIVGWTVQERENELIAKGLIEGVITYPGRQVRTVHSDNGAAMTSKSMRKMLGKHHVDQSLIRPGVSNDNAQIESFFRTTKYGPTWPGAFDDIDHAVAWFGAFVEHYNDHHHHSSLAGFTPAQVYDGSWLHSAQQRQATLDAAYQANPHRYRKPPVVSPPPQQVTLNLAHKDGKTHTPPTLLELLAG